MDFSKLSKVSSSLKGPPKNSKSENKPTRKVKNTKRIGEPGIKIGTAEYKQIGQYCDICDDIFTHFFDNNRNVIFCNNCGHTTKIQKRDDKKVDSISISLRKCVVNYEYHTLNLFI